MREPPRRERPEVVAADPDAATPKCPICRKPRTDAWRPFCSRRCADVDLGRWLSDAYAIDGGPAEPDEDD